MTNEIVGHQSESKIPYSSNQIWTLIFYHFHTTKTRLAAFVISFAGKHYPFVPYAVNLRRYSIIVKQNFTMVKSDLMCISQSSVCIVCHQTLVVWEETTLLHDLLSQNCWKSYLYWDNWMWSLRNKPSKENNETQWNTRGHSATCSSH